MEVFFGGGGGWELIVEFWIVSRMASKRKLLEVIKRICPSTQYISLLN